MLIPKQQEKDASTAIASQMTYMFPVLTVLISFSLPAALPLYWTVTTLFAIGQQWWIMHREVETIEEKTDGNKKERKKNRRTRK
jgi:membrane protein insertase Oxa1/YidC/SpoIIIJ